MEEGERDKVSKSLLPSPLPLVSLLCVHFRTFITLRRGWTREHPSTAAEWRESVNISMLLFQEYSGERQVIFQFLPFFAGWRGKNIKKVGSVSTLYLYLIPHVFLSSVTCITAAVPQKHRFLPYYPCSPAKNERKEQRRGQKERKEEEEGPIFSNCNTGNKRRGGEERRRRHYE